MKGFYPGRVGTLLLIRHGQASFGARDYDQLSDHGRHQAAVLGLALAERQVKPARLVTGSLRRQRDTLDLTARAAGWELAHEVDPRWNEFSHGGADGQPARQEHGESAGEYERRFDFSIDRWFRGEGDSAEPFGAFMSRVTGVLEDTRPGPGETYAVFTSSGVIGAVCAHLLGASDGNGGGAGIWPRLNRVVVNSGVTKVVTGRRGTSLVSFNDHSHLDPGAVSYR